MLQEKVVRAQQACSEFENGQFSLEWGAENGNWRSTAAAWEK